MSEFNFDEILNKIGENPDIVSKITQISKSGESNDKLSEMISALSPLFDSTSTAQPDENDKNRNATNEKADTFPAKTEGEAIKSDAILTIPIMKITEQIKKNSALLSALKPYLNKSRCDLIDSVLKMAQVADLMRLLK